MGLEDPNVVVETKDKTVKKNRKVKKGDFIHPWTPGYDSYKPWIK